MKKVIMSNLFYCKEKNKVLFIVIITFLIFSILYLIISILDFSKIKSEFISKSIEQLSNEISYSFESKDYLLVKEKINKSYLLDYVIFTELRDINNNIKITLNSSVIKCTKSISEPIFYENKVIGNLSYCLNKNLSSSLKNKLVILTSLIILFLLLNIFILFINSRKKINTNQNNEHQIQALISYLSKLFSHDFRKPFNLLKMLLSNIKKSKNSSSEISDLNSMIINEIEKNITNVDSFIYDIIELGSEIKLNKDTQNFKTFIENIISSPLLINETNNLKLDIELVNVGNVNIDLIKFNKVIINLILCTIKHSENTEKIWVKTGNLKINKMSFIYIKIGSKTQFVPQKDVEQIFNLFYFNETKGSSGLELAICKKIIEAHDGIITCNSCNLKGTEFIINLPKYEC